METKEEVCPHCLRPLDGTELGPADTSATDAVTPTSVPHPSFADALRKRKKG